MKRLLLIIATFVFVHIGVAQLDTVRLMFETNKYQLTGQHQKEIDSLLAVKDQISRIKISGHTDNVGSAAYNLKLSEKRAETVYNYLTTHGIDTSMLFVKFYGETDPRVANTNSENQAVNRRVDIVTAFFDTMSIAKEQAPPPPKQYHLTFSNGVKMNFIEGDYGKSNADMLEGADVGKNVYADAPVTLITNTTQMRQSNILTQSVDGDILISQVMACFGREACGANKPVEILIPVKEPIHCDLQKMVLWDQVIDERGISKWKVSNEPVEVVTVEGKKYFRLKKMPPCGCVNFDVKCNGGCGPVDTFSLEVRKNNKKPKLFTKVNFRKVEVEDSIANMLYDATELSANRYQLVVMENSKTEVRVNARLLGKKNRAYRLNSVPLSVFEYDKATNTYFLTKKTLKVYKMGK